MVNQRVPDARTALLELGMTTETATLAIPYVWFTPGTSDPYSPVVIMIVEGIQHCLRQLGYRTRGDGFVDAETDAALGQIAGLDWKAKPWIVVVGDLLAAKKRGRKGTTMLGSLGHYDRRGYYGSLGVIDPKDWTHARDGSCMGLNPTTVAIFKSVQAQANRVLKARGQKTLAVDGFLGAKTTVAVAQAIGGAGAAFNTCDELARQADTVADQLRAIADAAGAPPKVSSPAPRRRTSIKTDPTTGQTTATEQTTTAGMLPFEVTPVTLGIVGLGAVLIFMGKATKRRRAARRQRR
jgi:hypothetical protein